MSTVTWTRRIVRALLLLLILLALTVYLVVRPAWFSGGANANATPRVNPESLAADVHSLVQTHYPRSVDHMDHLNAVADWLTHRFTALSGGRVDTQRFDVADETHRNVLVEFGPVDGPLTVVAAHYDSAGATPGADDNASGVAGLLALGQLLAERPPTRRILLAAVSLEEPPHFASARMGSAHLAQRLQDDGSEVAAMIALEMIGFFDDQPDDQEYPAPGMSLIYPDQGNYILVVDHLFSNLGPSIKRGMQAHTELPVYSINAPSWVPGVDFSDHRNFWAVGLPAVMITDTAFYRNPHYHELSDTPDTLDYRRMAQVIESLYGYLSSDDS